MAYCEDYPACGHHTDDPCTPQWYDAPYAFDTSVNPHALCDHEYGECGVDYYGEDVDPEDCEHDDKSFAAVWRGEELWYTDTTCDRCDTELPDEQETDPHLMEFFSDRK